MSVRSKGILAALAVVVGVAAAGYAAAPWLLAAIAVRSLDGIVDVQELDIESVGLSRIDIAAVRASNPGIQFDAQRAMVRFDPWPFRIHKVRIETARLAVTGTRTGSGDGAIPAPPSFPVSIDKLSLRAATPWGELTLPASIDTAPGAAGGLDVAIRSPGFSAILTNPDENRHNLDIFAADETSLLSMNARTDQGLPAELEATLEPERLAQWLRDDPVVPSELRRILAPYAVEGNTVAVRAVLEENLDFNAELRGIITVRDTRDPAERFFEAVELEADSGYTLQRAGVSWSGSGDAGFRYALNAETVFTGRNPSWRWNDEGLTFRASAARLDPLALEADTVEASTTAFDVSDAQGSLRADALRLEGWPGTLAYYDINGKWSWRNAAIDAEGTGGGAGLPRLDWKLANSGSQGSIEINVQDTAAAIAPSLQPYTAFVASDLEVLAGDLEGRYLAEWSSDSQRTVLEVNAGSVDANLGGMEIRGLNVRIDNMENGIDRFGVGVSAPTLKLAAGTVAQDFEMDLRLALPRVHLDAARTRLFHGDISLRPVSFTLDDDEIEIFMDIDALSLEEVMALLELESTQLTGEVAGPVRMVYTRERGLEVNKGDLHSIQAGVLKFSMDRDSPAAAQYDNIALRALENFQYQELNASVLYQPDGEYRISARILGSNPDVLDGHPIAFNPTIEGRLPALFRAFFITGDFNRAIIERLQEERGVSTPGETSTFHGD